MKGKEPRKVRSYKMEDTQYDKAMTACAKKKVKLSQLIQNFVIMVGNGFEVTYNKK